MDVTRSNMEFLRKSLLDRAYLDSKSFDLFAEIFIAQRPDAEVLAIVGQDSIAALPETRACPLHDFAAIETSRVLPYPDAATVGELLQGNLLDRSATKTICQTGIVDDASLTDVDSMVTV